MDEAGYRRSLSRRGKKSHVVEELLQQVRRFEAFMARERHSTLESATAADIHAYVAACEAAEERSARVGLRGLALYYSYTGNATSASVAGGLREERVAAARKSFRLREVRGANPEDLARLEAAGIADANQMLAAGSTPAAREELALRTGVALPAILEYVKLADLSRITGVKAVRARLYYDGGFDTLDKIAVADPQEMRAALVAFVERTGFDGIAPLPKEARFTVAAAQTLPRMVDY